MYGPAFDASHDYEHIQRVVALAHRIYTAHEKDDWTRGIDKTVLYVACMVHDVGDSKYHVRSEGDERDQEDIIRDFLKEIGCAPKIWGPAAFIAARVPFSRELEEPVQIKKNADSFPELRIVQDADRLDGLGAIGIGRCFVFGGINEERRKGSIQAGVELHYDRFEKYLELMKTDTGKRMAMERLGFMATFREQWFEDTDCGAVL
ncbi:uncharacterized protein K460DRAFT_376211 [Cucurbitaria berberidis CBS 394.84]|uniref:HD/PDEase domain-containing protein n=1 Tax=Cucurbitaria berberidis CBS 394.84 TaxID=1168544 RepID=A0A9P4L712_9PLEO|nr:uncharacterized protein K460DRAFT_376211 [Cucurbitaria berberidis CBS 394.84]KAF1844551.1 hypothetical protein K460DRAFT_376211 [Cucurbitaria berberidis CBS 394.84]